MLDVQSSIPSPCVYILYSVYVPDSMIGIAHQVSYLFKWFYE